MQEAAHLQHCGLFISPGNKPEAHGVLSKSGGLGESAVLQGQSQPFTPQRAKVEGQLPPKHTAGDLHIKKKCLCRSQSLLQTLCTLKFGTVGARRSCLGSTRKKLGRKKCVKELRRT